MTACNQPLKTKKRIFARNTVAALCTSTNSNFLNSSNTHFLTKFNKNVQCVTRKRNVMAASSAEPLRCDNVTLTSKSNQSIFVPRLDAPVTSFVKNPSTDNRDIARKHTVSDAWHGRTDAMMHKQRCAKHIATHRRQEIGSRGLKCYSCFIERVQ